MRTATERLARTRVRVSPGSDGRRCAVRTAVTLSDPGAASVRPFLVNHGPSRAVVSLVPEGALLLAGDAVELDLTVDAGAVLEVIEPGGTVAFGMPGSHARWDVRIQLGAGAVLTWAGEPFVVTADADVARSLRIRYGEGARLALRESLVLGRSGEPPGVVRQTTTVVDGCGRPVLCEDLPLDRHTAPALMGPHRVMSSVLAIGLGDVGAPTADRYDLAVHDAVLWRRLSQHSHTADLGDVWETARAAALAKDVT